MTLVLGNLKNQSIMKYIEFDFLFSVNKKSISSFFYNIRSVFVFNPII